MNNLRNKVQLIGNIGLAPEIVSFENGGKMAKMRLATNESYKNAKGEKVDDTQWHSLVVWGKQAETIEKYVKKGQLYTTLESPVNTAFAAMIKTNFDTANRARLFLNRVN